MPHEVSFEHWKKELIDLFLEKPVYLIVQDAEQYIGIELHYFSRLHKEGFTPQQAFIISCSHSDGFIEQEY